MDADDSYKIRYNDLPVVDDGTEDVSIDDLPPPDKVKFLPATIAGLANRFNKLFRKFCSEKKYEHRNELVSLLDNLLQLGGITPQAYKAVNGVLNQSLGSGIGDDDDAEDDDADEENVQSDLKSKISETVDYLIRHDKEEVGTLLDQFSEEEEFEDDVQKLKKLVDGYINGEILGKYSILDDIQTLLRKLSNSKIKKSDLHRLDWLLGDIKSNHYRVEAILNRMNYAIGEDTGNERILTTLKQLLAEELLTLEQYESLVGLLAFDLDKVVTVIKTTKIGRGLNFLPRMTQDLLDKLKLWGSEFAVEGTTLLQKKIAAVLDELMSRKVISKKEYKDVKEKNDIE